MLFKYLNETPHQVTISVIGCGGTGSQLLQFLARANKALIALGKPGLHVIAYDGDEVSEANVGRQLFQSSDIGLNKAVSIITAINRYHGTTWEGCPAYADGELFMQNPLTNIIITCLDKWAPRVEVHEWLKLEGNRQYKDEYMNHLWIDCGNGDTYGQVIVGSVRHNLPSVVSLYPDTQETPSQPSCSLAEALESQDLIINSAVAMIAYKIVWQVCRNGELNKTKYFINTDKMEMI